MESLKWTGSSLKVLDQTKLPFKIEYIECMTYEEVASSIKKMQVRGAPAIGAAAAFGIALAAKQRQFAKISDFQKFLHEATHVLQKTRPTAVNLFWALDRMKSVWSLKNWETVQDIITALEKEAIAIFKEDIELNKAIGKLGMELVPDGATILTHCNAGALATAGFGTALGVIRACHKSGKEIAVYASETRPLLQGARLTVTELMNDGINVTLITDNMAGYLMKQGKVDAVVVGADRIAANGDVANKIGTYSLAVLANYHEIPFYVAAPYSTIDMTLHSGKEIIIEERDPLEVRSISGNPVVADDVPVYNPAFDVTPHSLISAIITDKGVLRPPYEQTLKQVIKEDKNE